MNSILLQCRTNPADRAGVNQRSFCGTLLVGTLRLLLLRCLLSIFLLRLNLLLPTSHGPHRDLDKPQKADSTFTQLSQFN